jgi:hypothetical protein
MERKASSFARRKPKYKPQPRVLVLCEDTKSCLSYLREASQHFRCQADVEVAHPGRTDPLGIVQAAKARRGDFDRVYCAFDRDAHPSFEQAVNAARQEPTVEVVPSYPSYEYWLLLHFRMTRRQYAPSGNQSAADSLIADLRNEPGMATYAKGSPAGLFEQLLGSLPQARLRAAQVLMQAEADGGMNPSTRLHLLMDVFEQLGRPQALD